MMKVYIGFDCEYNGGLDVYRDIVKVFDDETKALVWKEDLEATEYYWREYVEFEVE